MWPHCQYQINILFELTDAIIWLPVSEFIEFTHYSLTKLKQFKDEVSIVTMSNIE